MTQKESYPDGWIHGAFHFDPENEFVHGDGTPDAGRFLQWIGDIRAERDELRALCIETLRHLDEFGMGAMRRRDCAEFLREGLHRLGVLRDEEGSDEE